MRSLAALSTLILAGCGSLIGGPSRAEVAWANAPDGRTHAILSETNGGATTSFGYIVELHSAPHDGSAPINSGELYGAVRSECAYGVDLHWLDRSTLALRFASAEQVKVPNSVTVDGRQIQIVTQPGHANNAAPCGGMAASRPLPSGSEPALSSESGRSALHHLLPFRHVAGVHRARKPTDSYRVGS
jgi:hypothetical protein